MESPGTLLGLVLIRTIQVAAVLLALWSFWHGLYVIAAGISLLLAYYAYLVWRPIETDDLLEPPP